MSMLLFPEKKICYLLPLHDELLTPRKLIDGLDNAEVNVCESSHFLRLISGLQIQCPAYHT